MMIIAACLYACDVEDCISTKSSAVQVEFYSFYHKKKLPIWINDTVSNDTLINQLGLLLNPAVDTTSYQFVYIDYKYDTIPNTDPPETELDSLGIVTSSITFSYTRRQRIISESCGVEQSFYKLEIVDHDFDSAVVVNDTIDRFNPVNVQIYF